MDLTQYFERVVMINLKRRPERLMHAKQALSECKWPFKRPQIFSAVDGAMARSPRIWRGRTGEWACTKSHLLVLEQAIDDGVDSVLIIEDDICFIDDFSALVHDFLQLVPQDWDGLMLGGQHIIHGNGWPKLVKPHVLRCIDCQRTHCYAIRGAYMAKLGKRWRSLINRKPILGDNIMGGDLDMQRAHKVYAPELFFAGQNRNVSDITGFFHPKRFWNPPGRNLQVISLQVPRDVMEALRAYGVFTGYEHDKNTGIELQLMRIIQNLRKNSKLGNKLLREWLITSQWEVCGDENFLLAVWHPDARTPLIRAASPWPVVEVKGSTIEDVLHSLPRMLTKLKI